jgi:hypothetical protein
MKKIILLFLVFYLLALSGNLMAEEWGHGFTLVSQKSEGRQIMDKFIPVKRPSFLLLKPEFSVGEFSHNKDFFNIQFHDRLKLPEKLKNLRKILKGVGYGFVIGGSCGAIIGYGLGDDEQWKGGLDSPGTPAVAKAFAGALIGAVIGGIIGGIIAAS